MTKQEFEERLGRSVTASDYEKIEQVYIFHPSISEVEGKDEIVALFKIGGIRLIKDMLPTAMRAKELEIEIGKKKGELEQLKNLYEELKN